MFNKILIANRGEIACRIMRTAKRYGIHTVAVFSDADIGSLHVTMADEAYRIGPPAATKSYLNQRALITAALDSEAQAIHPGYGFLSENPDFAAACVEAGLVFIGPPATVIREMGVKSRAKRLMQDAGLPVVPGCYAGGLDKQEIERWCETAGYPVLIKADYGGGGKGIRTVHRPEQLDEALDGAGREAVSSFGNASLLVEKCITEARHIEVQIFRDWHNNAVHLFERDCSLQRRHQKIIEEAPAASISSALRVRLHEAAVRAAAMIDYVGAGTVEFLVDREENFYFLEINTRLQVEHPVTEMITGQDLVYWQLLVAANEPLPCSQSDLHCGGHAIEARLYAENPERGFLPSSGVVQFLQEPEVSERVRVDSGVKQGDYLSPHYDPLFAKLIVHGRDRSDAIASLIKALLSYRVAGIVTNIGFLLRCVDNTAFQQMTYSSQTLDRMDSFAHSPDMPGQLLALAAIVAVAEQRHTGDLTCSQRCGEADSPWSWLPGFRLNLPARIDLVLVCREHEHCLQLYPQEDGYRVHGDGFMLALENLQLSGNTLRCVLNNELLQASFVRYENRVMVFWKGWSEEFLMPGDVVSEQVSIKEDNGLRAPVPGKVAKVFASVGDVVTEGDLLMVLEAMKMEYSITAPTSGEVTVIHYEAGDAVREGEILLMVQQEKGDGDASA